LLLSWGTPIVPENSDRDLLKFTGFGRFNGGDYRKE
jgi:hypothetical protein